VQPPDIEAFPVALNLRGRAALVLGGGEEAVDKVPKLLRAGARVTLVAPQVAASLADAARKGALAWYARTFEPTDLYGSDLVLLTDIDPARAAELRGLARRFHFWLCTLDQPDTADFFLVSTVVRGPVQIGISTSGRAPLLARALRVALERGLGPRFGEFARSFAALRARVRDLPKDRRREVLAGALAGFAMEVRVRYPGEDDGQGAGYPPDEAQE
jgi:siroheme synthase-like protein